jgi:hypothetical protein
VLAAIAEALRLADAESDHLHVLAGTAPSRTGLHRRDVRPSVLALLDRLPQTAGFVVSVAFEVLAWNSLTVALMEDFAQVAPEDRNLARRAFLAPSPPEVRLWGLSDAAAFQRNVVMDLRLAAARYPADPGVIGLIEELRTGSEEFASLWERRDVRSEQMLTKTFHHPIVGEFSLDCDTLTLADRDQRMVLYSAPQGSSAAEALAYLNALEVGGVGQTLRFDATTHRR